MYVIYKAPGQSVCLSFLSKSLTLTITLKPLLESDYVFPPDPLRGQEIKGHHVPNTTKVAFIERLRVRTPFKSHKVKDQGQHIA